MDPTNKRLRAEAAALRDAVEAQRVGATKGDTNSAKGACFAIHVTPPSNELDIEYPEGTERPDMPYKLSGTRSPVMQLLILTIPTQVRQLLSMANRVKVQKGRQFQISIPQKETKRQDTFKIFKQKGRLIEVKHEIFKTDVDDQYNQHEV